ncbi:transglycosylase domain-containing protein [Ktedonosporobacter rubrisoli]|nr:transglycosylase domain-containing protein [Ktedonosporobacter rubrisoli]
MSTKHRKREDAAKIRSNSAASSEKGKPQAEIQHARTQQDAQDGQAAHDKENGTKDRNAVTSSPSRAPTLPKTQEIRSTQHTSSTRDKLVGQAANGSIQLHKDRVDPETLRIQYWRQRRKVFLRHISRKYMRQARQDSQRTMRRFWVVLGSVVAALLVIFLSVSGTGAYLTYQFYSDTQSKYVPRVVNLRDLLPRDNLKVYDSKGVIIGQLTDQGMHTAVQLQDVSQDLQNATVAIEDKNFWTNPGIDIPRIIQAAISDLSHGRVVEGGSTITQQLIKRLVVGNQTSLIRKLEEVMLTPSVNSQYTKRDILEMYLNSIFYGEQAYGVDAAATVFFGLQDKPGKPASSQLDLAQAAMLAGLPQSPYSYDPRIYPEAAQARFEQVLSAMYTQGYITNAQRLDALKEGQSSHFFKRPDLTNRAPHFFNFVLRQLEQEYHLKRNQLSRSDMQVYTTLDIGLQDKILQIARNHIDQIRDTNHVTNAAEVLIDFHTGAIRSLLGSIDYNDESIDGQFDVATQAYRQPGSSYKPFVYVTAFKEGSSPAQAIDDASLTINLPGSNPPTFTPHNYDMKYHGHMTLRCALQNSLNIPAVKVLQHAGIAASMQTAHDMGVSSYEGTPGYSLVLGGLGVRLIDETSAYGTFANGGVHVPYYAIQKIVFANTHNTIEHAANPGKRAISKQLAYMMTSVLSDNDSRLPEFFDCNVLQLYSNSQQECRLGDRGTVRPSAAKTGTTTDFRDNWTLGYTTDYVLGVWAGNDDNTPMSNVTGVDGAGPLWHDAMLEAEQGHPIRNFTNPGGLERATVTYADGVTTTDWFMPGTEPKFTPNLQPTPNGTDDQDTSLLPDLLDVNSTSSQQAQFQQFNAKVPGPYCPSSYSFAFPPPGGSSSGSDGWW